MAETHVPAELSRMTRDRANGICEYCRSQERFSPQRFSVEHIKPQSAGGNSTLENLALACQGCNGHKYTSKRLLIQLPVASWLYSIRAGNFGAIIFLGVPTP